MKIIIEGAAGEGKTALADIIRNSLSAAGISCVNRDVDAEERHSRNTEFRDHCIVNVAIRSRREPIVIETVQVRP